MNPEKNDLWQKITSLPPGGTVTGSSSGIQPDLPEAARLWLCSPAGLFFEANGVYTHQLRGIPFHSASAVFARGRTVLAAGYPNLLLRSPDAGQSWYTCHTGQIDSAVTCFAASPNFSQDATLLAGTDGDGVLRSTDGGSSWQLSNFGLRSFNILALASTPAWESRKGTNAVVYREETVYAATEEGVYQSPNGGRAWRFAGEGLPPAVPVLSLAAGRAPNTVFAGTDGTGIYRSRDGGKSWQAALPPAGNSDYAQTTVNALLVARQGEILAATSELGILASADGGQSWRRLLEFDDPILHLDEQDNRLLAGTAAHGLLVSCDRGKTWEVEAGLSARYLTHLSTDPRSPGDIPHFLVSGPVDGVWADSRGGWQPVNRSMEQPVTGLHRTSTAALALTSTRVLRMDEPDRAGAVLFESPAPLTALTVVGNSLFLGSLQGELWRSPDGGQTWTMLSVPFQGARILALEGGTGTLDGSIFALTRADDQRVTQLWLSLSEGADWKLLFQERTGWETARMALLPRTGEATPGAPVLLAIGTEVYAFRQNRWQPTTITTPDAPLVCLLSLAGRNLVLASRPGGILLSSDRGDTWEAAGLPGKTITAMQESHQEPGTVYALTSEGTIYMRKF